MRRVPRGIERELSKAARSFPAVVLTGPRCAGKTWLLRHLFPSASYFLLEDPDVVARLRADPHGFLDAIETPVILDEVQHVPELLAHVRARIDRQPRRTGRWLMTGSQEAPLMQGVSESMAGRAAVLQLYPLSRRETAKVKLLHGGYPEVVARPRAARQWFASFVQTYLERDVRAVTAVKDLATFRRFEQGLEVDFLVPARRGAVRLIECKAGRTVTPQMAAPMRRLAEGLRERQRKAECVLVHRPPRRGAATAAIAPGVRALPWQTFVAELPGG